MRALREAGLDETAIRFMRGDFSFKSGVDLASAILDAEDRPGALICANDDMAVGALFAAHRVGLSVPAELSITGFDDTPIGFLTDRDKLFSVGVSIPLPLFNRNQGAKAEAATTIAQSQRRREFVEAVVRATGTAPDGSQNVDFEFYADGQNWTSSMRVPGGQWREGQALPIEGARRDEKQKKKSGRTKN